MPTLQVDPFETDIKDFINFKAYLGFETEKELDAIFGNARSSEDELNFRNRSISFTYKLENQIKQLLPDNVNILNKMTMLSVKDVLNGIKELLVPLLAEICIPANNITKIEHQWNSLSLVNW